MGSFCLKEAIRSNPRCSQSAVANGINPNVAREKSLLIPNMTPFATIFYVSFIVKFSSLLLSEVSV